MVLCKNRHTVFHFNLLTKDTAFKKRCLLLYKRKVANMGLSKLSERCIKCKYVKTCNHKRMEALAYLPEQTIAPAIQPMLNGAFEEITVKHDYRNVKVNESITITIDVEEIKRKLEESYYPNFLQYGG